MIKVIKKLFKSMEKQCNIPVDSSCNCINCNNCRQNQYSKYRYDRYISAILTKIMLQTHTITDAQYLRFVIMAANGVVED